MGMVRTSDDQQLGFCRAGADCREQASPTKCARRTDGECLASSVQRGSPVFQAHGLNNLRRLPRASLSTMGYSLM
jgi:hypothetical protein